jgi:serine/threonine protein kinase/formylglycine-generating enzyme required for sulfatase activity
MPPALDWTPPQDLDEYRILRPLGRGGMGQVFLAQDTLLDRAVAIKFIASPAPDRVARERFLVEARAIARLQHPNVVAVYRAGEIAGRPYLVSEFVRGRSLDRIPVPVSWREALRFGLGLARGLAVAHRRGVLHRDIKPANAIVADDGDVKLLDFGLAKLIDALPSPNAESRESVPVSLPEPMEGRDTLRNEASDHTWSFAGDAPQPSARAEQASPSLTRVGAFMGTPLYMAPEVWRGEPASARSDIYSLGVLLHYLCTGRTPHRADNLPELMEQVCTRDVPSLASIMTGADPGFAAVIDRCLRRIPSERFSSADELRDALEKLAPVTPSEALPEGNPYRGLSVFDAAHRALFFGRAAEIRAIVDRLRNEPFVLVAGDSGVGKSSLCRAGVLPRVADGALGSGWATLSLVPGRHPVSALAAALASYLGAGEEELASQIRNEPAALARALRKRSGIVILIDQLEELITLGDPEEAQAVAETIAELAVQMPGVRLLATVRGDFLTRVASLPGLSDPVTRAFHHLRPLAAEGLREAVVGPARARGFEFETHELVERLVTSTARATGGMPLLQFALAELWEARDAQRKLIPTSALDRIGGVEGALARHADGVLLSLSALQRTAARRIFSRLVTSEGTRARRSQEDLVARDSDSRAALDKLIHGRIIVATETEQGVAFEVAHEALIRGWPTLQNWLDEDAGLRLLRERLDAAALEWERLGRSRDALWGERQLTEAIAVPEIDQNDIARAFLRDSRRILRRARLMRRAVGVGFVAVAVAVYGGVKVKAHHDLGVKVDQRLRDAEAAVADAAKLAAEAGRLRTLALARFDSAQRPAAEIVWAQMLDRSREAELAYSRASGFLETAVMLDGSRRDVRDRLSSTLYERALLAERANQQEKADELLRRLEVYDEAGAYQARWRAPARLTIETSPPAEATLERYQLDEREHDVLVEPRRLGQTPVAAIELQPGSYLLTFSAPGRVTVRYPVLMARDEQLRVSLPLPNASAVPDGFVYVPAGRFLFGTSAPEHTRKNFYYTVPLHAVTTGAYLIARHEVTFAQWLEYLHALDPAERRARTPAAARPGGDSGTLELKQLPQHHWQLNLQPTKHTYGARDGEKIRYLKRDRRAEQDWLQFPVTAISWDDATAYTKWLDASGRLPGARLCDEYEWERAARGADDREFPHGNRLDPDDANFDETYGRDPLAFGPDEVGSHPASRSPFAVDDMAGNVWEWTRSVFPENPCAARSGSFYYEQNTERAPNRQLPDRSYRDPGVGLRVCVGVQQP